MSDLFSRIFVLRGARSADEVLRFRHIAGALFRRFALRNAALCPRRRGSTCAVARNGKHRSPTRMKCHRCRPRIEKRLPLSRERAYAHVSLFPFFAFTSSPTCHKIVIHRSIGVKVLFKSLHILPISRGFFFDNPLLFKILLLFTTKMRNSINVCDRRNHCTVCFFRARVRSAPQRTNLSFPADCKSHFLPIGARLSMADGANCYLETG